MTEVTSFALLLSFLGATLRLATPLLFAGLGGYTSERSGIFNVALEGIALLGAFGAAAGAATFHNPWAGLALGIAVAVAAAAIHAFLCINLEVDHIISGIAINFLAAGIPPVICKALYNVSGNTPQLQPTECIPQTALGSPLLWLACALALVMTLIHKHHKLGQYIRFAGEHPAALESQGVSVKAVRWQSLILCGIFCGFAGAYLSIDHGTAFFRNMTSGRGFIALAALIVGRWTPHGMALAALVFGAIEASQILLQGVMVGAHTIPVQWIQMIPYMATLATLCIIRR